MRLKYLLLLLLILLQDSYAAFTRFSVNGTFSLFICDLQAPPGRKFVDTTPSLILDGNPGYFSFDRVGDYLDPSRYQGVHYPDSSLENLRGAILVLNFNHSDFENISCFQFLDDDTIIEHTLINYLQPAVTIPGTFSTISVSLSSPQPSIPATMVGYVISKMWMWIIPVIFLTCFCAMLICFPSCCTILFCLFISFCYLFEQTPNSANYDDNNTPPMDEGNISREDKTLEQSKNKLFHSL